MVYSFLAPILSYIILMSLFEINFLPQSTSNSWKYWMICICITIRYGFLGGIVLILAWLFYNLYKFVWRNWKWKSMQKGNEIYVSDLYKLLFKLDSVCSTENIKYWVTSGTLLGAIRHKGLIPWDDDIDIFLTLENAHKLLSCSRLAEFGLEVMDHPIAKKIVMTDSLPYLEKHPFPILLKKPYVDIFIGEVDGPRFVHSNPIARSFWPKEYYFLHEIKNLQRVPFGSFSVPAPQNAEAFLSRFYGEDWRTSIELYMGHGEGTCKISNSNWEPGRPFYP